MVSRVLVVFGTRPEAIKLFPVVEALRRTNSIETRVCVTAQHRHLLDQVLRISGLKPDIDLDLMRENQSLDDMTVRLISGLGEVLDRERPDRIIVQGDTSTAMSASLAAYYRKIPVAHVEAGLRSGNIYAPWPEEVSRRTISVIADRHFAPTERAAATLLAEGVAREGVFMTGNTVIDALLAVKKKVDADPGLVASLAYLTERFADKRLILVTAHRRENFGESMTEIADAILDIADRGDTGIVFPLHPNPNVNQTMRAKLSDHRAIVLLDPQDYPCLVHLLDRAYMVLTDSGGIQEEAPAFGKPVLVLRDTTERPEGIEAGTAQLVGTDRSRIVAGATRLLDDADAYASMARAHNPFGDGHASERIATALADEG